MNLSLTYLLLFSAPFIGGLAALMLRKNFQHNIKPVLAFGASYLFAIAILKLAPEVYGNIHASTGIYVLGGFFFQVMLEYFSKGIEHGHFHLNDSKPLKVIPIQILFSLSLHAFLEGLPLGGYLVQDQGTHQSLLMGIALHELPAAFAMISIFSTAGISRKYLFITLVVYSMMGPMGVWVSDQVSSQAWANEQVFNGILGFVVGVFLHISTTILFENSEDHRFTYRKLLFIVLGTGLALLTTFN